MEENRVNLSRRDESTNVDLSHLFNFQEIYLSQASKLSTVMTPDEMREILYFEEYSKVDGNTFIEFIIKINNIWRWLLGHHRYLLVYHCFKMIENNLYTLNFNKFRINVICNFIYCSKEIEFQEYKNKLQKLEKYLKTHIIYQFINIDDNDDNIDKFIKAEETFERCKEITNWIIVKKQLRKFIENKRRIN